jgi:hypothetical protein
VSAGHERGQLSPWHSDVSRIRRVGEGNHAVSVAEVNVSPTRAMPNGWFSPSRNGSRVSATPSQFPSRSSVMRFALTPMASARFIVLTMA